MSYYQEEIDDVEEQAAALALLEEWLVQLRSGQRVQGQGFLRRQLDNHVEECCVGVLMECAGVHRYIDAHVTDNGTPVWSYVVDRGSHPDVYAVVSPALVIRLGVFAIDWHHLYEMNDRHGNTFLEIADYIESTYVSPRRSVVQ